MVQSLLLVLVLLLGQRGLEVTLFRWDVIGTSWMWLGGG